jgi:hypothetical protein
LTAETEITVTQTLTRLSGSAWGSFSDFRILCDDATYAPIALDEAKAELNATIENAPAALSANIGDGAFQIPAAGVNTYSDALAAAQAVYDATDATVASIEQAKTDLEAAIEAYNALEVNAPADGQLFSVSLANGSWTYTSNNVTYTLDKEAMTYMAGDRNDMGGYNIKYTAEANTNLAQAFTFTKVEGNDYKMSQIDAEGNVRYMCTGVPYSGNTSQIRTTINADEAMRVTVIPTETEGVWNLKNVAANNYIGAQDAGVFTVNSHINFNIVETTKPSIAINTTAAGWGTVILPFAVAELPEGVNAYSCAEVDGSTLTLVAVTALEANKPYIIEGAWNETLTGDAQGTALTYTEGLLTGVYADTPAPAGEFVLQNNNNKVAFYEVEDGEGKQPTVGANRCYLTWEEAGVRALFFPGKETTGIDAINALVNGNATIYNASGAQIPALQKGMNIIKTKNGGTRKVMVK